MSTTTARKLLLDKRAWKKLATMFRSKLLCLKRSKAYKRTARGLNAAVSTMLGRRRHPHRFRLKKRPLARPPSDPGRNQEKLHHHYHQRHGFVPVSVDDLLAKPTTPVHIQVVQPAVFVGNVLLGNKAASETGLVAGESSKIIKARSPVGVAANQLGKNAPGEPTGKTKVEPPTTVGIHQLEGVDLRAELFIAKFKEEMRLQRQRSFEK